MDSPNVSSSELRQSIELPEEYIILRDKVVELVKEQNKLRRLITRKDEDGNEFTEELYPEDPVAFKKLKVKIESISGQICDYLLQTYPGYFNVEILDIDGATERKLNKRKGNEKILYLMKKFPEIKEAKPYDLLILNAQYIADTVAWLRYGEIDFDDDCMMGNIFKTEDTACLSLEFFLRPHPSFYEFCQQMGLTLRQASRLYKLEQARSDYPRVIDRPKFDGIGDCWPFVIKKFERLK